MSETVETHLDTATVRKRMGVVALAVPSQLSASLGRDFAKGEGAASPSAGDSRRYNGGSIKMHPTVETHNAEFSLPLGEREG